MHLRLKIAKKHNLMFRKIATASIALMASVLI